VRPAAALLLVALLPALTYLGHWAIGPLASSESARPGAAESSRHHAHCHLGLATCSDQPAPPNARAFPDLIELPAPNLSARPLEDATAVYHEFVPPPPDQPPKPA